MRNALFALIALSISGCCTNPEIEKHELPSNLKLLEGPERSYFSMYEYTDPKNGERFIIVSTYNGVAITKADPPLPVPEPVKPTSTVEH